MKKILTCAFLAGCWLGATGALAAPIGNQVASAQTAAAASSLVLNASGGILNSLQANNSSTAGYLLVFDASSAPADGTVTPKFCYEMAANTTLQESWQYGVPFVNGVTLVYSSTGCFSKTASATAFMAGQSQ
jgi:hypothetical protein